MTCARHIASLERTCAALGGLLENAPPGFAAWKPEPAAWSPVEIAAHLLDEEREDFRVRIDFTLHRPGQPWPGIDPQGWVTARRYADRDLPEVLEAFRIERERSIAWLKGLVGADWNAAYTHPSLGVLRAGDLLAAWSAHDLLHLRQLLRRQWEFLAAQSRPFHQDYAGAW